MIFITSLKKYGMVAMIIMFVISIMPFCFATSSLSNGLKAYFKMDDGSNKNATDISGNSNLFVQNGVIGNGSGKIESSRGTYDTSNYFSSNNASIQFAVGNDFTYSFWVNMTNNGVNQIMLAMGDGNSNTFEMYVMQRTTTYIRYELTNGFNPKSICDTNIATPINQFTHIIITWNSATSNMSIYENGDLRCNKTFTNAAPGIATNSYIGQWQGGNSLTAGYIDELGIWNRTLNSTEIYSLYNSGNGLPYPFFLPDIVPNVTIKSPLNGSRYVNGTNVSFTVNVTGTNNLSINITNHLNFTIYNETVFNIGYSPYVYNHTINMTIPDNYTFHANASSYSNMTVNESMFEINQSLVILPDIVPNVTIKSPLNGSRYVNGTNVSFTVNVTGSNNLSINITNHLNVTIYAESIFNIAYSPYVYNHTINMTIPDNYTFHANASSYSNMTVNESMFEINFTYVPPYVPPSSNGTVSIMNFNSGSCCSDCDKKSPPVLIINALYASSSGTIVSGGNSTGNVSGSGESGTFAVWTNASNIDHMSNSSLISFIKINLYDTFMNLTELSRIDALYANITAFLQDNVGITVETDPIAIPRIQALEANITKFLLDTNDTLRVDALESNITKFLLDTNDTLRVDALESNITKFLLDTNDTLRVDALYANITNFTNVNESDPIYTEQNATIARAGNCPTGYVMQNSSAQGVQCVQVQTGLISIILYQGSSFSGSEGDINRSLIISTIPTQISIDGIIWQIGTDYDINTTSYNLTLLNRVWNDQRIQIMGY
jgi:hypothetical protein